MAEDFKYIDLTKNPELAKQIAEDEKEIGGTKRVKILDEMRGLCVLALIAYHSCYLLFTFFGIEWAGTVFGHLDAARPVIAALFLMISGISARLSRDTGKRALILLCWALAVSLITIVLFPQLGIAQSGVKFGVLHMLSVSLFLFGLGKKIFDKIPVFIGALLSLLLFCWFAPIASQEFSFFGNLTVELPASLYENDLLFMFGFHSDQFQSWDYMPLLPYFFMFLSGTFIGVWFAKGQIPDFFYTPHSKILGYIGRKALMFFLLHIPIFYGLAYFVAIFS